MKSLIGLGAMHHPDLPSSSWEGHMGRQLLSAAVLAPLQSLHGDHTGLPVTEQGRDIWVGYFCPVQHSFNRQPLIQDLPLTWLRFPRAALPFEALPTQYFSLFISFYRCQNWSYSEASPRHFMLLPFLFFAGISSNNLCAFNISW